MDDSAVAGAKFNGFDFPVFCEVGWDDEDLVLIHIVAADGKGFCHGEYEVGGAEYRACWKFRHGGFKGDIALGKAGVDPVCDGVDFCFGECSRADVLAVVVIGFPRGHVLGFRDVFDHVCIRRDFAVICEGHRPYFTVSMTRCAVVVYDRRDVFAKGGGFRVRRGKGEEEHEYGEGKWSHGFIPVLLFAMRL